MPTGSSHSPGRFPCNFTLFFSRLPKGKIQGFSLLFFDHDPCSCTQLIDVLLRQLSVAVKFSRTVINITVDLISISLFNQRAYKFDDLLYIFRNSRMGCCRMYIQSLRVLKIFSYIFFTDFRCCHPLFFSPVYYLVINICEILHEIHLVSYVLQISSESIEHDKRSGVSQMKKIVNRRSAHIDFHFIF